MPTVRKPKATSAVRVPSASGSRAAMSAMFSVPVIWYMRPMPMRMNVAPIVPITRYWKAAGSAWRRPPWAMSAYDESAEISRKTKTLKRSPVIAIPSRPVRQSR